MSKKITAAFASLKATWATHREATTTLSNLVESHLAHIETMQKETLSLTAQLKSN